MIVHKGPHSLRMVCFHDWSTVWKFPLRAYVQSRLGKIFIVVTEADNDSVAASAICDSRDHEVQQQAADWMLDMVHAREG